MDDRSFAALADQTLRSLAARIEDAADGAAEVDLVDGILEIELADGRKYVINKHAPNRQIWMASPVSGAWHFAPDAGGVAWTSTRGAETLHRVLSVELSQALGRPVMVA